MTEQEARDKVAGFAEDCARSGKVFEGSAGMQELIDIYNNAPNIGRGIKFSYSLGGTCELFADVCYIANGFGNLIQPEIGPWEAIQAAKEAGIWKPQGTYVPKRGDKIYFYYKTLNPNGTVKRAWYHAGVVTNASAKDRIIYTTESNVQDRVLMLAHDLAEETIVGYIAPDYASLAAKEIPAPVIPPLPTQNGTYTLDGVVSNNKAELRWVKKNA